MRTSRTARLARAITAVLLTADLTLSTKPLDWLAIVEDAFVGAGPGPVPSWASNTFVPRFQALHLHLAHGRAEGGTPRHERQSPRASRHPARTVLLVGLTSAAPGPGRT